jgi:alcohol dehydrogenase class IV
MAAQHTWTQPPVQCAPHRAICYNRAVAGRVKGGEDGFMIGKILTPRELIVGGGAVRELPDLLARLGLRRPLIVTDAHLIEIGKLAIVTDLLDRAAMPWAVFSEITGEPDTDTVDAGLAALKAGDFDCMIALGGGSPMDTAVLVSLLDRHGGALRDYKVPRDNHLMGLPVIAIPTTAGTGAEATRFAVVTDLETDEKMPIMGAAVVPTAAIVDYELTFTVSFRTTADTGIDSLTHALEAYVSRKAHPTTDTLALAAMGRLARHIRTACREPENAEAREQMMIGALQAGMAFSNASVALVHGMSRPIGAFFHVPHGLSNAMLLPAVTAFSAPAALRRYGDCARAMGLCGGDVGDQAAVAHLLDELRGMNVDLEVPTPKAYGIGKARYDEVVPTMAEQALVSGSPNNNPRIPSADEIVAIYREVYE